MALPNPVANLFSANDTPNPDLNWLVSLYKLPFKITWDLIVPDDLPQEVEQQLVELGQTVRMNSDWKSVKQLQRSRTC